MKVYHTSVSGMKVVAIVVVSLQFFLIQECRANVQSDAGKHQFVHPQAGFFSDNPDKENFLLLLRRKLIPEIPGRSRAMAIWYAADRSASAFRIYQDEESGAYTIKGKQAIGNLWASYSYWATYERRQLRNTNQARGDRPPRPNEVATKTCTSKLPDHLAQKIVILWDTALLNVRAAGEFQQNSRSAVHYSISTSIGGGSITSPKSDSANGQIRSIIYALHDICWNGPGRKRLDRLRTDTAALAQTYSSSLYRKGTSWASLESAAFRAGMENHDAMSAWLQQPGD